MPAPFLSSHERIWADLIDQGLRFDNPKVVDIAPLRRAATIANRTPMPEAEQDNLHSPFYRLVVVAKKLERGDALGRQLTIDLAHECMTYLKKRACGSSGFHDDVQGEARSVEPQTRLIDHEHAWQNRADLL